MHPLACLKRKVLARQFGRLFDPHLTALTWTSRRAQLMRVFAGVFFVKRMLTSRPGTGARCAPAWTWPQDHQAIGLWTQSNIAVFAARSSDFGPLSAKSREPRPLVPLHGPSKNTARFSPPCSTLRSCSPLTTQHTNSAARAGLRVWSNLKHDRHSPLRLVRRRASFL